MQEMWELLTIMMMSKVVTAAEGFDIVEHISNLWKLQEELQFKKKENLMENKVLCARALPFLRQSIGVLNSSRNASMHLIALHQHGPGYFLH